MNPYSTQIHSLIKKKKKTPHVDGINSAEKVIQIEVWEIKNPNPRYGITVEREYATYTTLTQNNMLVLLLYIAAPHSNIVITLL